jgi:hypothetical protein
MEALREFIRKCGETGDFSYLTQLQEQPYGAVKRAGLEIFDNLYLKRSLNAAVMAARGLSGLDMG